MDNMPSKVKKIVANYGGLSISRPDLIELLRKNKPELIKELDNLIDNMLKE